MSALSSRSSQRAKRPVIRFSDEQAAAVPAAAAAAAEAAVGKKKRPNDAISSPTAAENKTASTTDDNIDTIDGAEYFTFISKEEDDDCHESALAANYGEFKATPANAKDADYNLERRYKTESNANQRKQLFVKPSEKSRVAATVDESGSRFNFLDQCNKLDGKSCEFRAKEGLAALDKKTRAQVSFFKSSIPFEVKGELIAGSGKWETIHFASMHSGKGGRHAPPDSLVKFCAGCCNHLNNKEPGDPPQLHRKDANGDYIFLIRVVDWKTEDRNDIIEAAKRNAHVRDACIARRDELDRLRHEYGIVQHSQCRNHFYELTKKDDPSYGAWKVKSLNDVKDITGGVLTSDDSKFHPDKKPNQIMDEMLPNDMNQEESLTTCRGTFIVKRISLERFESTELQKLTARNKPALDVDLVKMRKLFGATTKFSELKFYLVVKVGISAVAGAEAWGKSPEAWGTNPFHSWGTMKGSIGGRHLSSGKNIKVGDLPEMDQEVIIQTFRGKFKVKQVSLDKYLEYYPTKKK
eukprot:scaffold2229_cov92-Skeletonema_dohrnii-CCMP3373.AAC.2